MKKRLVSDRPLALILLVAFALRFFLGLVVLGEMPRSFGWYPIAQNVLNGNKTLLVNTYGVDGGRDIIESRYYMVRPPFNVLFNVMIIHCFGGSLFVFLLLQAVFSTLTIFLFYRILEGMLRRITALMGALGAALYPYFITRVWNATEDNLYILFIMSAFYLLFRSLREGSPRRIWLVGLLLGCAFLTRSTILFFFLLLVPVLGVAWKGKGRLVMLLSLVISFAIAILPWLAYGYSLYQKVILSDHNGSRFWVANNRYIDSMFPSRSIDQIEFLMWRDLSAEDARVMKGMDHLQRERYLVSKAYAFIKKEPVLFIKGSLKKVGAAFSLSYNPQSSRRGDVLKRGIHGITYIPLLLLGLLGLILYGRRHPWESLVFSIFFFSLLITSAILWAHTRHTIPYHFTFLFGATLLVEHGRIFRRRLSLWEERLRWPKEVDH